MDIESENKNTNEETQKKQEKQIFQILKELQSLIIYFSCSNKRRIKDQYI